VESIPLVNGQSPERHMEEQRYAFRLNGREVEVRAYENEPLLYVLRDRLGMKGTRFGCGLNQCGACSVLLDGRPAASCDSPIWSVAGRSVTTIEGIGSEVAPHPVQAALVAEQAGQCGYCLSGMVVHAVALLERVAHPTEAEVRAALDGCLCRCGSHNRIVRAVLRAAEGRP
jgi:nicotinate dehydrogenase subunit A